MQSRVLAHVNTENYQPVKPSIIAKQLGLPKEQHRNLRKAIKRLVKKGQLCYGSSHLVRPAQPAQEDKSLLTGRFHRTTRGFGFVRPSHVTRADGRDQDIFVPQRRTLDAANDDIVKVRVKRSRRDGETRQAGTIVEIVERATRQFIGAYRERHGRGLVLVDGGLFAQPIPVGDPGAKGALEGDKVVIELIHFPSPVTEGEGVLTEVLGQRGEPGIDTLSIMREFQLEEDFPETAIQCAREQAATFDESINDRVDLTAETTITIDPHDARDFDDAISLTKLANGHWILSVHIADVAHFVPPDSALDVAARDRGTSVYLPDRVLPMLPEIISNNLASLQPDQVRYAKTAVLELTEDGARVATEIQNTAIVNKRRFTYEEVDDYLKHPDAWKTKLSSEVHTLLQQMHELAMLLRQRRLNNGAIELTLPEVKIELNKKGEVQGAKLVEHTESHQIIEEFMLAANEAVAEKLTDQEIVFLRRIHEAPDPRKLKALSEFIQEMGIACEDMQSRFEIKRVIAEATGKPEEKAINFAILRSMQKAYYGPEQTGHYALHSRNYCHFTSPIRRYPDLTVHRILNALIEGKAPVDHFSQLLTLGEHLSEREQRATKAERELVKVKLLSYLAKRIGSKMETVVTGVEAFGLFAQGLQLPAEGLLGIDSLGDDHYYFDAATHSLLGHRSECQFRLGDILEVEITRVNIDRRELDFRLLRQIKTSAPRTKRSPPEQSRKKTATSHRSPRRRPAKKGPARKKGRGKGRGKKKRH